MSIARLFCKSEKSIDFRPDLLYNILVELFYSLEAFMKKILCIFLALLLAASFAACSKKKDAEDDLSKYLQDEEVVEKVKLENGDLFYIDTVDTTTVIVTGYEGSQELHALTIPETLAGKRVIGIGDEAFYYCNTITSVAIPETVTSIGSYAFAGCSFLASLDLPSTVRTLGVGAFYGCERLSSLTFEPGYSLGLSLAEIPEACFYDCTALTEVTVPSHIEAVGKAAFFGCSNLATLVVEEGVLEIRAQAFQNLSKLTSVTLPDGITCDPLAFAGTPWGTK